MKRPWLVACASVLVLAALPLPAFGQASRVSGEVLGQASSQPVEPPSTQTAPAEPTATVKSAGAVLAVSRTTGQVLSLRVGPAGTEEMGKPSAAPAMRPYGHVEVVDLHSGRGYSPIWSKSAVGNFADDEEKGISFRQQYEGAPFEIDHLLQPVKEGVRWNATLRLLPEQRENRSVTVCWMLPLPQGWKFWAPNDTAVKNTDGVIPYRAVYGHAYYQPYGIILPLAGVFGRRGGAAVFSPPDVVKTQIVFDVFTQRAPATADGMFDSVQDLQYLRLSHTLIGLRPGKELKLAICLAGCKGNWRSVLGQYVDSYPELFEPIPVTRKWEGMYGITGAANATPERVAAVKDGGVTMLELHASFPEYGQYVLPESLKDPRLKYICKPHPGPEFSLASNRQLVEQLNRAGVAAFMYFYNVHANRGTIDQRFAADLMLNESGKPMIQYRGEPTLHAQPDSPFGKHLLEQMDLMLQAYGDLPGIFVDNYSIQKLDFAHDDGVTMVHDRPAYDLNRNHQAIGPACFQRAHKAGKIIMVNKLTTIESARFADVVLAEGMDVSYMKQLAFACAYRPFYPLGWHWPEKPPNPAERSMQYLLLLGGMPELGLLTADKETVSAYRPLTDCLKGKRWVWDADPITLPAGFEGQIFRIDPSAPRAGDVVVTLAGLDRSWKNDKFTDGLTLKLRLPGVDQFKAVTWLGVEASGRKPKTCPFEVRAEEMIVQLPPVGAAGVLRLSAKPAE